MVLAVVALVSRAAPGPDVSASFVAVSDEVVLAASLTLLGLAAIAGIAIASRSLRRDRMPLLGLVGADHLAARPRRVQFAAPIAPSRETRVSNIELAPANVMEVVAEIAPETVEERAALIAQLVTARPCSAIPFVSRKARARRARIIVHSLTRRHPGRHLRFYPTRSDRQPPMRCWNPATA